MAASGKGSRWGSFHSQAVAGVEARLDTILADNEEATKQPQQSNKISPLPSPNKPSPGTLSALGTALRRDPRKLTSPVLPPHSQLPRGQVLQGRRAAQMTVSRNDLHELSPLRMRQLANVQSHLLHLVQLQPAPGKASMSRTVHRWRWPTSRKTPYR